MRKNLIFTVIFALIGGAAHPAMAQDDAATAYKKFALIGDDQGVNLQLELRYQIEVNGFGFSSQAKPGTRAAGWIDSYAMKMWLKAFYPDVVLVCFGTNEARFGTSVKTLAEQFRSLAVIVSNGHRHVIWLIPPKFTGVDNLENVRTALMQIRDEGVIEIFDFSDEQYAIAPSGIHLTHPAYRGLALAIWARLRPTRP